MSLCRHYVRELRRSVLVGTPEMDKAGSKRSSAILENMGELNHPAAGPSMYATEKEKDQDAQMSAYLREEAHDSPQSSADPRDAARPSPHFSTSRSRDITSESNSPAHAVARQDIRASAEKILYTFLLPGAEREITLPGSITQDVTAAIEEYGRDDPEVFDVAKDYVFQAMERDAFPGFLRMKALGNLIPPSLIMRLIFGLVAIFGGFWAGFVLIFLDMDRLTRCWVRAPIICDFNGTLLTRRTAHSALHYRCLFPCFIPVLTRSCACPHRPQRVHPLLLLPHPRALRSQAPRQTLHHGPSRHYFDRGWPLRALHPGPRQETLEISALATSREIIHEFYEVSTALKGVCSEAG